MFLSNNKYLYSSLLIFSVCLFFSPFSHAQHNDSIVLLDIPNYPEIFELDPGEIHIVEREIEQKIIKKRVKLISVTPFFEPNYWFNNGIPKLHYSKAKVVVEVDDQRVTLLHRPYQMPVTVNGIRIFVETIKGWAKYADIELLNNIKKQVRLSVVAAEETWGPKTIQFPIKKYRWRSASYNNTWSGLVPYNRVYYHRGEDYGAIPDILDVTSPINGTITQTPLPNGDGMSNSVIVQNEEGFKVRIAHMNIESINSAFNEGEKIKAGDKLGKTGMTWGGRKAQKNDPHLHVEFGYEDLKLASFPYMMEAYFRKYRDPVLAVAGGYQFTEPGMEVILDGSRSLAGPNQNIESFIWKLHNGKVVESTNVKLKYEKPGLYTEELNVRTESGEVDRDFLQVRVFNSNYGRDIGYGWVYHTPVRDIKAGDSVLFWERIQNNRAPITIDFGDGSFNDTIEDKINHTYEKPGRYVITFSSIGPRDEPIMKKLEVVVE